MIEPMAGDERVAKAVSMADRLNSLLYELVMRSIKSPQEGPRPYFAVAAIGYGTTDDGQALVQSAFGGTLASRTLVWTSDLATNPLRVEERERLSQDGRLQKYNFPVWIEPVTQGGTPMGQAFNHAGLLVKEWIGSHPAGFPPLIVNLTDGESTDGDPRVWAERIRSLETSDGPALIFNLGLSSSDATPILFPSSAGQVAGDPFAHVLFEMSSVLPPFMIEAAQMNGLPIQHGARGLGYNADLRSVVTFLNIGTNVSRLLR